MEIKVSEDFKKSTLHSISPYIGKLRPDLVNTLIKEYSQKDSMIFDPFCGSGTVPLEAWVCNRRSFSIDLNYYAYVITRAKLSPLINIEAAIAKLESYNDVILKKQIPASIDSAWVNSFFHPKTLSEITSWVDLFIENDEFFFLGCLLGILHHQRPGFLSYPSSHGAPYLRNDKYPITSYPEMYEYRNVYERLKQKVIRSYKVIPSLDYSLYRNVIFGNTLNIDKLEDDNVTIITSPPYMKSLTYARDNRLRLWFLGFTDWNSIDKEISVGKTEFLDMIRQCFMNWSNLQKSGNYCILIVGDIIFDKSSKQCLPQLICEMALKNDYDLDGFYDYPINSGRKVVKGDTKIKTEKICIFKRR